MTDKPGELTQSILCSLWYVVYNIQLIVSIDDLLPHLAFHMSVPYIHGSVQHGYGYRYVFFPVSLVPITVTSQITSLTIVYSTVYSGADQRKHQSSASLAFVRGIHRGPVNSPHKWPVTRKIIHLMTSSCIIVIQSDQEDQSNSLEVSKIIDKSY